MPAFLHQLGLDPWSMYLLWCMVLALAALRIFRRS